MRVVPRAVLLTVVAMLCLYLPGAQAAQADPSSAMLQELNGVRQANGLPALRPSPSLQRTAGGYASYILRRDYFGHLSQIRASGRFRRLGEILAMHRGKRLGMRATVRRWLRSPGHRSVILNRGFRFAGANTQVGRFQGRRSRTWVVQFGNR